MGQKTSKEALPDIAYGASAVQGHRPYQEDKYAVHHPCPTPLRKGDLSTSYFAVFDGHGGVWSANYLVERLHDCIATQKEFVGPDKLAAIHKGFYACDTEILSKTEEVTGTTGATACVALVDSQFIYTGNAGDTRAVLCRDGVAVDLTIDHKPTDPDELKRIIAAGGAVPNKYAELEDRGLAVSRALGDTFFKLNKSKGPEEQVIICSPHLDKTKRQKSDQFLILATDGLWNVMDSQQVCDYVLQRRGQREQKSARGPGPVSSRTEGKSSESEMLKDICAQLAQRALDLKSKDNITVMVVEFTATTAKFEVRDQTSLGGGKEDKEWREGGTVKLSKAQVGKLNVGRDESVSGAKNGAQTPSVLSPR